MSQFPTGYRGWGFDIGAADGMVLSNTFTLEHAGWNILCVEAMHIYSRTLTNNRSKCLLCAVGAHAQEWGSFQVNAQNPTAYSALGHEPNSNIPIDVEIRVPVLTLNQIFFMSGFPKLDLVSIDIEGGELEALKGLDLARWHPRVIVAECWPDTDAAEKMRDYLGPFGYRDQITLEHDHGFVYERDHWRPDRPADHHGAQTMARPGEGVPVPADEPRGVRRRSSRRGQKGLGRSGPVKP